MAAKKRPRTERRELARATAKMLEDRQKLAKMEVGGTPARPIDVVSASLVEMQAASMPCPLCGGKLRIDEHEAKTIEGVRLRVARVACVQCGVPRSLYFRITAAMPN